MRKTITITLEGELRDFIVHLAGRNGRTEAETIRLIIDRAYRNNLAALHATEQLNKEKAKAAS